MPYFDFQVLSVASEIPCLRQISFTGIPAAASFTIEKICASPNPVGSMLSLLMVHPATRLQFAPLLCRGSPTG